MERKSISRNENGRHEPSYGFIQRFTAYSGFNPDWLLCRSNIPVSISDFEATYPYKDTREMGIRFNHNGLVTYLARQKEILNNEFNGYINTLSSWDRYARLHQEQSHDPLNLATKLDVLVSTTGTVITELAESAGIDRKQVGRYRKGEIYPGQRVLVALADYFHVSTDFLLFDNITVPTMRIDLRIAHELSLLNID